MRVCEAGINARKRPAMPPAPAGAVRLEVRTLKMCGLRRRNGSAEDVRMLARRREKKRCSSRWNKRIEDRESESRKLGKGGVVGNALGCLLAELSIKVALS